MGDYSKPGQNENVDFRVTKESEEMLVKNWVSSPGRVEEGSVQVSVREEHCNAGSKYWKGKKEKDCCN